MSRTAALRDTERARGLRLRTSLLSVSAFCARSHRRRRTSAPAEDIRDIRGPKLIRPRGLFPRSYAGAALLALCAYGIWRWQRRAPRAYPLLPYEMAAATARGDPPADAAGERTRVLHRGLRHRAALHRARFGITATQRTTEEFLQRSARVPE